MPRTICRIMTALAVGLLSAVAMAGPFGVSMGAPVTSYGGRHAVGNAYDITVPSPNAEFERYSAIATSRAGICKVWGTGRDHANDSYGTDVKAAYNRLRGLLDAKYGRSEEISFIKHGALWDSDREWVMSIRQNERSVVSFWTNKTLTLPDGLVAIALEVKATSSSTSYLELTYEFTNFEQCQQEVLKREGDSL